MTKMSHYEACGICHTYACTCPRTDQPKSFTEAGRDLIVQTNQDLIDARHAYYVLNSPVMTDQQYDEIEKRLKAMTVELPQFKHLASVLSTVGSDLVNAAGRIKHRTPMLSLENNYTFDELIEWCEQYPGSNFVLEPKVDGASCSLLYLGRKLVKAVTRGDGEAGEDVTKQMAASGAVPLTLNDELYPETPVEIRGEVFITTGQFDKLNAELEAQGEKPYASPRNLAAGSMKLRDLEEVKRRGLRFFVWQVDGLTQECLQKRHLSTSFAHQPIQFVAKTNVCFPQPIFSIAQTPQEVVRLIDTQIRIERETVWHKGIGMQTDGVVIKLVDPAARKEAGAGSKFVNWGCCFKFPSEKKGTLLKDVIWQTGRTGNLTPVGVLEPINVSGAMISRVNLNNWSFIQDLGIEIGDEVLIHRGGEVIPVCTGISHKSNNPTPIPEPTQCSCGFVLTRGVNPKSGVITHECGSFECPEQLKGKLLYIADRSVLEIDELGPELVNKLVDGGYVTCLSDLVEFANDINNAPESDKVSASVRKMAKSVEQAKSRDWDRWMAALEIPGIGRSMSKVLATLCRLQPSDLPGVRGTLQRVFDEQKIEGIGDVKKAEVLGFLAQHGDLLDAELQALYDAGVRPTALIKEAVEGEQPLTGYVMCITGEFDEERDSLSKKLTQLGATMKTGVSKKLTHLLTGKAPGRSKISKANELNIPKLTNDWLVQILEENGMKMESAGGLDAEWD